MHAVKNEHIKTALHVANVPIISNQHNLESHNNYLLYTVIIRDIYFALDMITNTNKWRSTYYITFAEINEAVSSFDSLDSSLF